MRSKLILFALLVCSSAPGQSIPKGFFIPEDSLSPDHRYGVTVPVYAELGDKEPEPKNSLVEVKTGRVLTVINAQTGWDHLNHQTVLPAQWSKDDSLLLWTVDGKWFYDALVLLKLEKGVVLSQADLMKAGQSAILDLTKKAVPRRYAAAKKSNEGSGSAYPEGFSIAVEVTGPVTLPLKFMVNLTSNPKGIEDVPTLESHLEGSVDDQGHVTFKNFGLGASPGHSF